MTAPKHPMQPLVKDGDGLVRFKRNAIVRYLLDANRAGVKTDLNDIAVMVFSQEDRVQLAQLIGYSLCGFHELSYVPDAVAKAASAAAAAAGLLDTPGGCRDRVGGCPIHSGVEEEP